MEGLAHIFSGVAELVQDLVPDLTPDLKPDQIINTRSGTSLHQYENQSGSCTKYGTKYSIKLVTFFY